MRNKFMCKFFSLISDGKGTIYYFDWELRQKILKDKLKISNNKIIEADSHSSILEYLQNKRGYIGNDFDKKFNKYEYNPIIKEFIIDNLDVKDDSEIVKRKCLKLDFNKIVKFLIIHDIINPFKDRKAKKVNKKDIELLKKWHSVRNSVGNSVVDLLVDSLVDSTWHSVVDSVESYISSYFKLDKWKYIQHKKGVNPYKCMIDLWNRGIVPSYDGKIWRLHGYKGKMIWEDKSGKIK